LICLRMSNPFVLQHALDALEVSLGGEEAPFRLLPDLGVQVQVGVGHQA
jgi:hypothetical protein